MFGGLNLGHMQAHADPTYANALFPHEASSIGYNGGTVADALHWDRDTTGDPFIVQHTLGDDIKYKDALGNVTFFHDASDDGSTQIGKSGVAGVVEAKDASDVPQEKLNPVGDNYHKGVNGDPQKVTLAIGASITFSDAKDGTLSDVRIIGKNDYILNANIHQDGSFNGVISQNIELSGTDAGSTLALVTTGTQVSLKNNYGAQIVLMYTYRYE